MSDTTVNTGMEYRATMTGAPDGERDTQCLATNFKPVLQWANHMRAKYPTTSVKIYQRYWMELDD